MIFDILPNYYIRLAWKCVDYISMADTITGKPPRAARPEWYTKLQSFRSSSWRGSSVQIVNTVVPYLVLMTGLMFGLSRGVPYVWIILASIPVSLFLVRIFIFCHDCCHGNFTPSSRANKIVGHFTGALSLVPFEQWRRGHLIHHATSGQLDHRGIGDIYTMTFEEYQSASAAKRFNYRLSRNPFVLFVLGPIFLFFLEGRLPRRNSSAKIKRSVATTNLLIVAMGVIWSLLFGVRAYLLVQVTISWIAGSVGIWLFYIQHQFDPGYWARDDDWDGLTSSMFGASHYKLPGWLQWLTGNIGIHHLHHLQPGIPNYRLSAALATIPEEAQGSPVTIRRSFSSLLINLYYETEARFLSFREAHRLMRVVSK